MFFWDNHHVKPSLFFTWLAFQFMGGAIDDVMLACKCKIFFVGKCPAYLLNRFFPLNTGFRKWNIKGKKQISLLGEPSRLSTSFSSVFKARFLDGSKIENHIFFCIKGLYYFLLNKSLQYSEQQPNCYVGCSSICWVDKSSSSVSFFKDNILSRLRYWCLLKMF